MDGMETGAVADTGSVETTDQSMDSGSQEPQQRTTKPAAPKAPPAPTEYFDVKVNGRTIKMTRQEVMDHASMSHAANSKFNEAKQQRQKVDQIIAKAKSNPIEALMDPELGLSKDQIRDAFEKWYNDEFILTESMSEAEKKLRDAEIRLKKFEEQERAAKEKQENDELEQLTNKQRAYLQQQIVEALDKSGLPKTKFIASRMAFYMKQNLVNGWDAPMDLIVRQVKDEHKGLTSGISSESSVEQLIEMLGEDVINKIRRHDLEQLRAKRNLPPVMGSRNSDGSSDQKIYSSDVNKRLREMRTGKWV